MSEEILGATEAELAQPQGDANCPTPPVTREPILAFYSQTEVDRFMGKRLGEHRRASEAYTAIEPLLDTLRQQYGEADDVTLLSQLSEGTKVSGLRDEIRVPNSEDWERVRERFPHMDPTALVKDATVARALRAGFGLLEAVELSHLTRGAPRPYENGQKSHGGALRLDVSRMTDRQLDEVARRVRQGETIHF